MPELHHRITIRLTERHAAHLQSLLLGAPIPSARTRKEVQDLLRIQREQNRLGGLLKKALTEHNDKAALRTALWSIERNAAELRRAVAYLVRSR